MGNTFTVTVWTNENAEQYREVRKWSGESLFKALLNFYKIKRSKKYGCVSLEWR